MIKYRIRNKTIEIEYDTGLELSAIMKMLSVLDVINEVKNERKN